MKLYTDHYFFFYVRVPKIQIFYEKTGYSDFIQLQRLFVVFFSLEVGILSINLGWQCCFGSYID